MQQQTQSDKLFDRKLNRQLVVDGAAERVGLPEIFLLTRNRRGKAKNVRRAHGVLLELKKKLFTVGMSHVSGHRRIMEPPKGALVTMVLELEIFLTHASESTAELKGPAADDLSWWSCC